MAPDLRDRYRGTLLGLAVGNALGGPVEGRTAADIRARHPDGVRDIPADERHQDWDDDVDPPSLAHRLDEAPAEVADAVRAAEALPDPASIGLDGWDMGYTIKATQVGLWAARAEPDLQQALVAVVAAGGDTDTNGAVAGAVLGARLGASAIPGRWLEAIPGRDRLTELADRLEKTT